ncbi:MAG: tRNA dihydrouridine synthase DusB [Lachnospiraceae bacterium]|nr:tRNA dihydrouridine synthase DusB [Lachnospiraceae bacterium]
MIEKKDICGKLILAPMAGVTDLPFRLLCKEMGCDVLYTEMVSAKAIYYGNKNTEPLLKIMPSEHPIGAQLFGSEPELMGEMAARVEQRGFDFIDINMGCPMPKIVNNNEGSALMKDPVLAGKIIASIVGHVQVPVSIKIRKGFDEAHVNAPELARVAQESGASWVAVHGRTREQYYSGRADWDIIRQVKETVAIPVIGNGDLLTPQDVIDMKKKTGCDAFMIGRGAKGNPWIFQELKCYFETEELPGRPEISEIGNMMLRHLELMAEYKGEYTAIHEMRKHIAWYSSGMPCSARLREEINQLESYDALVERILSWTAGVK